jgi:hypothetical protein
VQLLAASVERVMAAHPSARLNRRSRLRAIVKMFQKEFEQFVILFSWIHQIAPLLKVETSGAAAPSQLLTLVPELKESGLPTALLSVVTDVEKITVAFAPHLFEYLRHPLLPRTNNDLALVIRSNQDIPTPHDWPQEHPRIHLAGRPLGGHAVWPPSSHQWGSPVCQGQYRRFSSEPQSPATNREAEDVLAHSS